MLTNAQFTSKLNAIKTSVRAARKNVQTCVIDAFEAVSGNSPDLTRLTRLRIAIEETHGLNAAKLIGYIGDHVANVSWAKQKDGTPGYKKTKKGEAIEVTMPDAEYYWYDWKPESAAETTFDFGAAIKRAVARAHKEGLVETPDDVAAFVQGMIMRGELEKALSTPEVKKAA